MLGAQGGQVRLREEMGSKVLTVNVDRIDARVIDPHMQVISDDRETLQAHIAMRATIYVYTATNSSSGKVRCLIAHLRGGAAGRVKRVRFDDPMRKHAYNEPRGYFRKELGTDSN